MFCGEGCQYNSIDQSLADRHRASAALSMGAIIREHDWTTCGPPEMRRCCCRKCPFPLSPKFFSSSAAASIQGRPEQKDPPPSEMG